MRARRACCTSMHAHCAPACTSIVTVYEGARRATSWSRCPWSRRIHGRDGGGRGEGAHGGYTGAPHGGGAPGAARPGTPSTPAPGAHPPAVTTRARTARPTPHAARPGPARQVPGAPVLGSIATPLPFPARRRQSGPADTGRRARRRRASRTRRRSLRPPPHGPATRTAPSRARWGRAAPGSEPRRLSWTVAFVYASAPAVLDRSVCICQCAGCLGP